MEKLLSIIISGKNDNFRGNTSQLLKFNLETTIKNIEGLSDVELILCDWGSEKKIVDDIFTKKSENFKCVYVPPEVAEKYNNGASYAYIHPHNTASRHSSGKYIMFLDTDTILLNKDFKKLYSFVKDLNASSNINTFYWASRSDVEYYKYKDLKNSNE